MINVAVLTISDSCSLGKREDLSGRVICEELTQKDFLICRKKVVPDDFDLVAETLINFSDDPGIDLVLTTGGTGLGPRDVTPEATSSVCEKKVPGLGEVLRAEGFKKTPNAVLSRGIAGIRDNTLIINLPGSQKAVRECLEIISNILPHAIDMMRGGGHD